jgi:ribonuclease BN (tRNA processing enzyme)
VLIATDGEIFVSQIELMFTGTGSPRPALDRANSGQLLRIGDRQMLIDCGGGTTRRLLEAGVDLTSVDTIFLTHLHSDHTLDYAEFLLGSWSMGRSSMRVFGPTGTRRLHELLLLEPYREDIEYRLSLGRTPAGMLDIEIVEYEAGLVLDEPDLTVTAAEVIHSTLTYALRFESGGEVLVHSGDTRYCQALVDLAKGADVLVHDVCIAPSPAFENNPAFPNLYEHLKAHHADPAEAGRTAREAGVRRLVLTHFLLGARLEQSYDECRAEFDGEIIMAEDLLRISCD